MRLRFLLVLTCTATAFGQSFEAASIKLNTSGSNDSSTHTTRGGINAENVTLRRLIERAYVVADDALFGPDWLGDERFDVVAKMPVDAPTGQGRIMLQSLLAERSGCRSTGRSGPCQVTP